MSVCLSLYVCVCVVYQPVSALFCAAVSLPLSLSLSVCISKLRVWCSVVWFDTVFADNFCDRCVVRLLVVLCDKRFYRIRFYDNHLQYLYVVVWCGGVDCPCTTHIISTILLFLHKMILHLITHFTFFSSFLTPLYHSNIFTVFSTSYFSFLTFFYRLFLLFYFYFQALR